ncbi:MAG: pantoate--beta-alanine ligase [Pseudomonadota bacterium]
MTTHNSIQGIRSAIGAARVKGKRIGLVPTMGSLHDGHLDLVRAARANNDVVVVSIFVNPLQFGPGEDFDAYPRSLAEDQQKLGDAGVDLLFAPGVEAMYPDGQEHQAEVRLPSLTQILCGEGRPGHFDGVGTVVLKLFNICTPDNAYFGEKDYQQLLLIRTLAHQFDFPTRVHGVPTRRADDGLALSSRNQYLTDEQRAKAPLLQQTLQDIAHGINAGAKQYDRLVQTGKLALRAAGFDVEYLEVRDAATLGEAGATGDLRIMVAANIGRARLIDNIGVER